MDRDELARAVHRRLLEEANADAVESAEATQATVEQVDKLRPVLWKALLDRFQRPT